MGHHQTGIKTRQAFMNRKQSLNVLFLILSFFLWTGVCPVRDHTFFKDAKGRQSPNLLSGNIKDMNGVQKDIVIVIKGTNLETYTNQQGYFLFPEIPERIITLEFRHYSQFASFSLGEVGYGKKISLEGILIKDKTVSVSRKEITDIYHSK